MTRASKPCSVADCPHLQPCPVHPAKPWSGSTRRRRIGKSGWQQQRDAKRAMQLHGGICHVCGLPGADEVDHVIPVGEGGPDAPENLRPIHSRPCHADKTAREAQRARRA